MFGAIARLKEMCQSSVFRPKIIRSRLNELQMGNFV